MTNIIESLLDIKIENMKPEKKDSSNYDKKLERAIEDKFLTPSKFSLEIENIVAIENCNHIDAVIIFCENNDIDIETVSKLVSKPLKERLRHDAINLNFMKQTSRAKLPL
jgi:hypothetical protein